jgi:hypothetical protein
MSRIRNEKQSNAGQLTEQMESERKEAYKSKRNRLDQERKITRFARI